MNDIEYNGIYERNDGNDNIVLIPYIAELEINVTTSEYGADADGRRGEMRTTEEVNQVYVVYAEGKCAHCQCELELTQQEKDAITDDIEHGNIDVFTT